MYYLVNKFLRKCSSLLLFAVMILPVCFLVIFIDILFFEVSKVTWFLIFLWSFFLLLSLIFTLLLLFMIRIYQIIDKWDQLFTIKNASTFLNLGIDGEKHLQFNLKQQDIWRLREKNELNRAAKKGV